MSARKHKYLKSKDILQSISLRSHAHVDIFASEADVKEDFSDNLKTLKFNLNDIEIKI